MWFKNLRIYKLKEELKLDQNQIQTQLGSFVFSHCASMETESQGFVAPLGDKSEDLLHICDGQYLFCTRFEKKLLPTAVIKDELLEKVENFTEEHGRPPKGKEKTELKDGVMLHLLPLAFAVHSDVYIWIDPKQGLVMTNTASAKKSETALALLRKALGSLPISPIDVNESISTTITKWLLNNNVPSKLDLGEKITMYSPQNEKKIVNAKSDNLMEEEILNHLKTDKMVSKIALFYDNSVNFVIDDEFTIKSIKLDDEFIHGEEDDQSEEQDEATRLSINFFMQLNLFSNLVEYLTKQFGGIKQ